MQRKLRVLLTMLAAGITLATSLAGASARSILVSNQNVRAVWGELELSNTTNRLTIRCQVTMEGSFHSRTVVKRRGVLIGYITRSNLGPCREGLMTIDATSLPWHLSYEGFTGILPNILTIRLLLTGMRLIFFDGFGNICETRTEVENNLTEILNLGAGGVAGSLQLDASRRIRIRGGPFGFCPLSSGTLAGTATVALLNTTTGITISLI